jgi:hypothetical protein
MRLEWPFVAADATASGTGTLAYVQQCHRWIASSEGEQQSE